MKTKNLFVICFMFVISFQSMTISKVALAESLISSSYFPIEVGMKWTYLEDNLNVVTNSVAASTEYINGVVTNAILQNGGEFSGSKINVSSDAYGIRRYREFSPNVFVEGVGFQDITVTYNPPLKFANATSFMGETVSSSGTLDYRFSSLGLYHLNYVSTSKLVKYENITVPLGTFVALKIQLSTTISGYINNRFINIPITQVSWVAKYIGGVKSIVTANGTQKTRELTGINFQPFLKAGFVVNKIVGIAPQTINFTDLSDGNISTWLWSFGDGSTSTLQNPSHTYSTPGNYNVNLSVSGLGGSDTLTKTHYIAINYPPPLAAMSVNQVMGVAPQTINFTDNSSGNISTWLWAFGDGSTSTLQNPSHTYSAPGDYNVSLSVSGLGGSDTLTKTHYIAINYPPPLAAMSVSQMTGVASQLIDFTDNSSGNISTWLWSFGDGSTSTLQNPSYTYSTPGNYNVSLSVSGLGGSDTITKIHYINIAFIGADINSSTKVAMADLVLVLQILTGIRTQPFLANSSDINGDKKIGLEEATYILHFIAYQTM